MSVTVAEELASTGIRSRFLDTAELARPTRVPRLVRVFAAAGDRTSADHLIGFIREHRAALRSISQGGCALLFRGFQVRDAQSFERAVRAMGVELSNDYSLGGAPRSRVTEYVWNTTDAPSHLVLAAHTELAYKSRRPGAIAFYCEEPPSAHGETPVIDAHSALCLLSKSSRQTLSSRKLRYRTYYVKKKDPYAKTSKPWPTVFGTHDRDAVERIIREAEMSCHWRGEGLIVDSTINPIVRHPATGAECLNLILRSPYGYWLSWSECQTSGVRDRLRAQLRCIMDLRFLLQLPLPLLMQFPFSIQLGDGSRLPMGLVREIHRALWDSALLFSWRRNDILILDNVALAHGRMNFVQPRRILTCFGDIYQWK